MSGRYLYAIVGGPPAAPPGLGLRGEPLALVGSGEVVAVVGEMEDVPSATADTVRAHDEVVRRLAGLSEAILPARFGTLQDPSVLDEWLEAAGVSLADALRLVAGREQMTLHVYLTEDGGHEARPPNPHGGSGRPGVPGAPLGMPGEPERGDDGPGTRYLAARRRYWDCKERVPELEALRPRLDALVAAERVELRATPPLRASVYHLIERGRSGEYRRAVETGVDLVAGVRVRVSGPWAPYAFAPAG